MKSLSIWIVAVACFGFTNAWANEQTSNDVLDKRISFFGGIQIYQAEGDFSSTKDGRPEIEVDMDDLDLDKNQISPVAGVMFNFGKRWNLRFDYFGYHDDSTTKADFGFEFEDLIVPVGARVDSSLDLDVYAVNLAYNFIHSERARFGVGVGVHAADIDLEISAKVTVAGEEISLGEGNEDLLAPVPNLYAYGAYAFTEKFLLRYGGGWLSANYSDYSGSFIFANAFLEYWPFKYAGFGAGYRYLAADIEYDAGDRTEEYGFKLPGPVLYVVFGF
jgi:hypothetical protein